MNYEKVFSIIADGETDFVEYKKSLAEIDKLGKSICGQLNANGGYGFIGISDSGKCIGVEVTDSTKKKLTAFKNFFDPWPEIDIDYVTVPDSDKKIICFTCQHNKNRAPYTFKGKPYLKTPSGIQPMPSEKYKNLLLENSGYSKLWESLPANDFSIDDLDTNEILTTFKVGLSENRIPEDAATTDVTEILTHFDLIQEGQIHNAAMVLFAKKIPTEFYRCFIRMGRFIDDTMDEVMDSRQVRGNAFQLLQEAQDFIDKHLPISSRYDPNQYERIDKVALPILAVREAIINAICHRDYSQPAGDISLYIFNDYLEIYNIGRLFGGLSAEQLLVKHPSRRRNEKISQVFFAKNLIDRFGSGIQRILRLCKENDIPQPEFYEYLDGFMVKFYFKQPIGPKKLLDDFEQMGLSERQTNILKLLARNNGLKSPEIISILNIAERTLRRDLNDLLNLGLIRFEGKSKNTTWFKE